MFKISNKVRRLTNEEKERYLKDGYLTGLPVFDDKAKDDLNDLLVSLSSRLSNDIDINQFLKTAHAVKALIAKNSKQIGDESIQIHGGIGMTDELNIGHFVKRLMMINVLFGDGDFHRQCFSRN